MMRLEHLKLLGPKAQRFEMGTGGTPEITFQEVADAMGPLTPLSSGYARYRYAGEYDQIRRLKPVLLLIIDKSKRHKENPRTPDYWTSIIELAIAFHAHDRVFTLRSKARKIRCNRWRVIDEKNFVFVLDILDRADDDLRMALRTWNENRRAEAESPL